MNKLIKFIKKNNKIIIIVALTLTILYFFLKRKENFENSFTILNADNKIKEILKKTNDYSKNNLIKLTHEWCANMRDSKSLSTSCLPLRDENNENEMTFIISVCCSTCYCQILKTKEEEGKFNYSYDKKNKLYYLMKNNKVVQIIDGYKNRDDCIKKAKNDKLYFPYLTLKVIKNKICK